MRPITLKVIYVLSYLCFTIFTVNAPFTSAIAGERIHKTNISELRGLEKRKKIWSKSGNIRRSGWIETFFNLRGNALLVTHKFLNDRKRKGYTGCATVNIYGPKNKLLIRSGKKRGLRAARFSGRQTAVAHQRIDLSNALKVGITEIRVRQWHCPTNRIAKDFEAAWRDFTGIFKIPRLKVGRAPTVVEKPVEERLNSTGASYILIENCSRKNMQLWVYHFAQGGNYTLNQTVKSHWKNGTCPNSKSARYDVKKQGLYRFRFVTTGPSCKVADPNKLGCIRKTFSFKGNPKSSDHFVARVIN